MLKSAKHDGNKEIADFILRKSAAIFAKRMREGHKYRSGREKHGFSLTEKKVQGARIARSLRSLRTKEGKPRKQLCKAKRLTVRGLIKMGALPPYLCKGRSHLTLVLPMLCLHGGFAHIAKNLL